MEIIRENFDLRPAGIIRMLDLRRPIYKQTAAYGHFGRTDLDLSWEKTDKAEKLKNIYKIEKQKTAKAFGNGLRAENPAVPKGGKA